MQEGVEPLPVVGWELDGALEGIKKPPEDDLPGGVEKTLDLDVFCLT